jgi:hypothetical protein
MTDTSAGIYSTRCQELHASCSVRGRGDDQQPSSRSAEGR